VTPESGAVDAGWADSSAAAVTGAGGSATGASDATVASAGAVVAGTGAGAGATAGWAAEGADCGGGDAVCGVFGAGGLAGVDEDSLVGTRARGGRKDSGSRYPFGSAVIRTPKCTYGTACSGAPDDPIAPTVAPSATWAPRTTAIDPRWTRVTE
jgi:hypothetical protein